MTPPPVTIVVPWPPKGLSANARHGHWGARARNAAAYREACYLAAQAIAKGRRVVDGQLRVTLRFVPPTERRRDEDNLVHSMKSGLDGIAAALGVNDARFQLDRPEVLPAQPGHARVEVTLAVIEPTATGATSPPSGQQGAENDERK